MNGFTREQEAFIEKVAWKVSDTMQDRLVLMMDARIASHISDCKTTKRMKSIYLICIGVAIGFGLGGGGIGYALGLTKLAAAIPAIVP